MLAGAGVCLPERGVLLAFAGDVSCCAVVAGMEMFLAVPWLLHLC